MAKKTTPSTPPPVTTPVAPSPFPRPSFLSGLGVGARPASGSLVVELADTTGTNRVVMGALIAAYGWNDETRLTREEFLRLRDEWLNRSAREVSK